MVKNVRAYLSCAVFGGEVLAYEFRRSIGSAGADLELEGGAVEYL